ncbi:ATP-grasp domain-containing protein [Aeoliella sp.]|uniref:ATP-grasp domain-containing protein n=1 Tax=Aeoliella sp. TaxID=2795800 RepID=UPI003CCBBF69
MPSLICSSRYTIDSQILRRKAQELGWETLRLDGKEIPEWFEPPDEEIAIFYTAPHVFDIARQLGRTMLGCPADWTIRLPPELLRRELHQTSLHNALQIEGPRFVKHSVSKAFPAAVYDRQALATATESLPADSLVHVGEPVEWICEFRCFIKNRSVRAISPYRYQGTVVRDYDSFPTVPQAELREIQDFAHAVVQREDVPTPPAFVLDVGVIRDRGWAVVECNECWASGIYACDPVCVLDTLLGGNVPSNDPLVAEWDFQRHYSRACAVGE